jgi:hypothetical protein
VSGGLIRRKFRFNTAAHSSMTAIFDRLIRCLPIAKLLLQQYLYKQVKSSMIGTLVSTRKAPVMEIPYHLSARTSILRIVSVSYGQIVSLEESKGAVGFQKSEFLWALHLVALELQISV